MTIEDTLDSDGDMSLNEVKREKEISSIFQWTKFEIGRITSFAHGKKQQIIKETASKLEGKIPTDTIAIEIGIQLQGVVSSRLIHECLDQKYKQKYKVDNAKKQHKNIDLAAKMPLNEMASKEVIVDAEDNTLVEPLPSISPSETSNVGTDPYQILKEKNNELREALKRQTKMIMGDQISTTEIEHKIPKERYDELKAAMDHSANFCYIVFDKNGIMVRAVPDIFKTD